MKEIKNKHSETEELVSLINKCYAIIDKLDEENRINYYPIAFFEVFVSFQVMVYSLFEMYCVGRHSSAKYCPKRKHSFLDEKELRAFLRTKTEYIDYDSRISDLSEYIFENDPFTNLNFMTPLSFPVLKMIRNYVAHSSESSISKLEAAGIVRPNRSLSDYLAEKNKKTSRSYFEEIVLSIYGFSNYLVEGGAI